MKNILLITLVLLFASCTDKGYIDTGISSSNEKETMYEYFQGDDYNWKLVREMIDKAGLKDMFDGNAKIMFLGPVDNSVRKWMWDNKYQTVADVPADLCKKLILRYTFDKVYQREEVPVGSNIDGGIVLVAKDGNEVRFFSEKTPYNGNNNLLITQLRLNMLDIGQQAYIASSGLKKSNGVIHSLDDTHQIGNFIKAQ